MIVPSFVIEYDKQRISMYLLQLHRQMISNRSSVIQQNTNRCSCSIWRCNIAGSIEWPEILMSRSAIGRCEFIGELLDTNTVNSYSEVAIGDCRIPCFHSPQWFAQVANLSVRNVRIELKRVDNSYTLAGLCVFGLILHWIVKPTVADGLNTISAPFRPNIIQFCGWWRP